MAAEWFDAIKKGNIQFVHEHVSEYKCTRDENDLTALMNLAMKNDQQSLHIVNILLQWEAGIQNSSGISALMIAAACGNMDMFQVLCTREIQLKDKNNFNAYAWAVFGKQKSVRDYIIQHYFQSQVSCYPKDYLVNLKLSKPQKDLVNMAKKTYLR